MNLKMNGNLIKLVFSLKEIRVLTNINVEDIETDGNLKKPKFQGGEKLWFQDRKSGAKWATGGM